MPRSFVTDTLTNFDVNNYQIEGTGTFRLILYPNILSRLVGRSPQFLKNYRFIVFPVREIIEYVKLTDITDGQLALSRADGNFECDPHMGTLHTYEGRRRH